MSWLERLVDELVAEHHAVAAILYGSRARGAEHAASDVDLLLIVDDTTRTRDARRVMGPAGSIDLDGWLKPRDLSASEHMHLRGARVLHDPEGVAARLLADIDALHARGREPVAPDVRAALRVWADRMLARIAARDDPDPLVRATARWRQAEGIVELLADAYALRGWWYPGPGPALRELMTRAPELGQAFLAALEPDAAHATFVDLGERVFPNHGRTE